MTLGLNQYGLTSAMLFDYGVTTDAQLRAGTVSDLLGLVNNFTQATNANKPLYSRADNQENRQNQSELQTTTGAWGTGGATVEFADTMNYFDPLSGNNITLRRVKEDSGNSLHSLNSSAILSTVAGTSYTLSFIAYSSNRGLGFRIRTGWTDAIRFFDLTNGAIVGTSTGAIIEDLGGGFYRVTRTEVATTTSNLSRFDLYLTNPANGTTITYLGDNVSGVYIGGVHVRESSTDPTYLPTTDHPQYAGVNGRQSLVFSGAQGMATTSTLADLYTATSGIFYAGVRMNLLSGLRYVHRTSDGIRYNLYTSNDRFRIYGNDGVMKFAESPPVAVGQFCIVRGRLHAGNLICGVDTGSGFVDGTPTAFGTMTSMTEVPRLGNIDGTGGHFTGTFFATANTGQPKEDFERFLQDYYFGSYPESTITVDTGLRTVVKCTIAAKHKKTLEDVSLKLVSKGYRKDTDAYPIIDQIVRLGEDITSELPGQRDAEITLENSAGSIGFNRRFSDLLEEYVILNRPITIDIVEANIFGGTETTTTNFIGVVSRQSIGRQGEFFNLSVTNRRLQDRPLNYRIKELPNIYPQAHGQVVPIVFGATKDVTPIRINERVWAYGTIMANTSNDGRYAMPESVIPELLATDSKGRYGVITLGGADLGSVPTDGSGGWGGVLFPNSLWRRFNFDGNPQEVRDDAAVAFQVKSPTNFLGRILTEVTICMGHPVTTGSPVTITGDPESFWTLQVCEIDTESENATDPELGFPGKVVAEAMRSRNDFITERQKTGWSKTFNVKFIFNKPLPLVNREGASGYWFVLSESRAAIHDNRTETTRDNSLDRETAIALANAAPTPVPCFLIPRSSLGWGLPTGASSANLGLLFKFVGADVRRNNHTDLLTKGYETAETRGKEGLSFSEIKLTTPSVDVGSSMTFKHDWSQLKFLVRSPAIWLGGQAPNPYASDIMRLLLSEVNQDGDWTDPGFTAPLAGHGIDEANTSGAFIRHCAISYERLTTRRQAMQDILFWTHGKLLPFGQSGSQANSLFFFGAKVADYIEISDEDFSLESFNELGLETVVNSPLIRFRPALLAEDGFGYLIGTGGETLTLSTSEKAFLGSPWGGIKGISENLYGRNFLRVGDSRALHDIASATASARLFLARYARPIRYIVGRVPLKKFKLLKAGDVVLLSHSGLPNFRGSSGEDHPGVKGSDATPFELAPAAALGFRQKRGRIYRCLVEGREIDVRSNQVPTLRLTLLDLTDLEESLL